MSQPESLTVSWETYSKCTGDLDAAVKWIRVVGEELVLAGFPGGDRTVHLASLRALIKNYLLAIDALEHAQYAAQNEVESFCPVCACQAYRPHSEHCPIGIALTAIKTT